MTIEAGFCIRCGQPLQQREVAGTEHSACSACGWVLYQDPKLVAGILLVEDNRLLLVKRDIEPGRGRWAIPGGYVDRGETVDGAAVRELREETGLEVVIGPLVGLYSRPGDPIVLAIYVGERNGGTLKAGHEVQDAKFWPIDSLPTLAFERDLTILQDWLDRTG